MIFVINFFFSMFSSIAFSVITNIPRRAFLACGLTGATGWMTFWILNTYCDQNIGFSNFSGALVVGLMSIYFAHRKQIPAIVFNVPSLIPLVPGGPAYMAMRFMMDQQFTKSMESLVTVLITSGAIALSFMFSNLIERSLNQRKR